MPMISHYEDVHEYTFLWLYTVMFRTFGDRMKNLLTDDTSNMFGDPVRVEYASVALFAADDPEIPTTDDLNLLVEEAFTGDNLLFYVEGLKDLPSDNPFR